ncbi:sulfotransferase family protein [Roseivirga pacifica]|uniref:sulfotransferase family protein n=1 Tax=Roseivirga pacifica TaxID=1267423 RepID=UPI003BAE6AF5
MIGTEQLILPDIFLAGTPKSGTTFLFDLLAQHAGINASNPKEPFYYVDDACPFNQKSSLTAKKTYIDFYEGDASQLLLDGTSQTIYQDDILKIIESASVKPRVIVVLRDPAKRILSSYAYTKHNIGAVKPTMQFEDYVGYLINEDYDSIRKHCRDEKAFYSLSNELDFSNYAKYLKRWKDAISEENLKVILFEELMSNTQHVLKEVLGFLGLSSIGFEPESESKNETVSVKNGQLHYILYKMFGAVGYRLPFKAQVKKVYAKLQFGEKENSDNEAALELLRIHFKPMRAELSEYFNLDLDRWWKD